MCAPTSMIVFGLEKSVSRTEYSFLIMISFNTNMSQIVLRTENLSPFFISSVVVSLGEGNSQIERIEKGFLYAKIVLRMYFAR